MHPRASSLRLQTPLASTVDARWFADMASRAQTVGDIEQARQFIDLAYAAFDQIAVLDDVGLAGLGPVRRHAETRVGQRGYRC